MLVEACSVLIGGLALEQFAGVGAALAMGIPLAEVLEQEQIAPSRWSSGDQAWKESIAESPDLQLLYQRARRLAEDCLARAIAPIDEDPRAWLGLVGALATRDDADELLSELGLTMVDVGCLGRAWSRKARQDPAVACLMQEIGADASPPERVVAAPVALRPFPWTPARPGRVGDSRSSIAAQLAEAAIDARPGLQKASYQLIEAERSTPAPADPSRSSVAEVTLPPSPAVFPALPFPSRTAGLSSSHPPSPPQEQSGETIAALPAVGGAHSLPFDRGGALGMLVLQRYAAMAAEIRRDPLRADEVMSRWGLETDDQRRRIHGLWEIRFRMNPALKAEFEGAVRDLLSGGEGPAATVERHAIEADRAGEPVDADVTLPIPRAHEK